MTTTHAPVDLRALSEQAEAAFLEEFRRLLTEADITLDQAVSLKGARDHAKKAHGVDRMDAAAKQFEAEMFSADADKPDHMLVYIDPAACGLADEAFEHVRTMLSRSHPVMILDTPGVTVADRRKSKKDAPDLHVGVNLRLAIGPPRHPVPVYEPVDGPQDPNVTAVKSRMHPEHGLQVYDPMQKAWRTAVLLEDAKPAEEAEQPTGETEQATPPAMKLEVEDGDGN